MNSNIGKIVIDEIALDRVKEIARKIYSDQLKPNRDLIMLQALADYITQQGGSVDYEVKYAGN